MDAPHNLDFQGSHEWGAAEFLVTNHKGQQFYVLGRLCTCGAALLPWVGVHGTGGYIKRGGGIVGSVEAEQ